MLAKRTNSLITAVVLAIAIIMLTLFGFAPNAFAAEETDNNVNIYCTYVDEAGNQVCGDDLEAGTYDVSFYTNNVATISVIEITATYDTEVVTINGVTDTIESMTSMGTVNNNGNFVIGYVADGDYTNVNAEAQHIATASVTFNQACDADEYITVSDNPNLTFIVADSSNSNYDNEYALVNNEEFPEYTQGRLTKMYCDVSPAINGDGYDITGAIMIANTPAGDASSFSAKGITVDVLDVDGKVIATDVTDENGAYTLAGVPAGNGYKLSIHGDTTVDRMITLDVNDTTAQLPPIGIVICDYNKDGEITATDKSMFLSEIGGTYLYADFNGDGEVGATDKSIFLSFFMQEIY